MSDTQAQVRCECGHWDTDHFTGGTCSHVGCACVGKFKQAEDRRAPRELADALRVRAGCLSGQNWEVPATVAMMLEAADTIERLSRVEQALREAVTVMEQYGMWEGLDSPTPGVAAYQHCAYLVRTALSASPSSQPKER